MASLLASWLVTLMTSFMQGWPLLMIKLWLGLHPDSWQANLKWAHFGYVGFTIIQNEQGIVMDQSEYLESLEDIVIPPEKASQKHRPLVPSEKTQLRQIDGCLNWIVQGGRPDLAFEAVDLSTKFQTGITGDLTRAVKLVHKLKGEAAFVVFPYQWYQQVSASHLFRCCSCQSQQWTRQHGSACGISSWVRRPVLSSVIAGLQGEESRAIHPSGRNPQPRRGYWGCSLCEKHSKRFARCNTG